MFALSRESGSSIGGSSSISSASLTDDQQQTPVIWAYEKGHDQIVALLKHYANKRPDSDVCSEYRYGLMLKKNSNIRISFALRSGV